MSSLLQSSQDAAVTLSAAAGVLSRADTKVHVAKKHPQCRAWNCTPQAMLVRVAGNAPLRMVAALGPSSLDVLLELGLTQARCYRRSHAEVRAKHTTGISSSPLLALSAVCTDTSTSCWADSDPEKLPARGCQVIIVW